MIRVVIADDHHLVRAGIRALLDRAHHVEVVGEAADGYEALALAEKLRPDVLVLDINMPGMTGIQVMEQVLERQFATGVVILSMYSDETLVRKALQKGANSYLLKHAVTEELLLAIRAASEGYRFLSPEVTNAVVNSFLNGHNGDGDLAAYERLSAREREVLKLVAEGETSRLIASRLGISIKTVESHRANLMNKLGTRDIPGLVRVAIKQGLVFVDE